MTLDLVHSRALRRHGNAKVVTVIYVGSALRHIILTYPSARGLLLQYHTTTSLQSKILFEIIFYTTANQQDPTSTRSVLDDLLYIYNRHNGIGDDTKLGY
jgi:hypothetical protein